MPDDSTLGHWLRPLVLLLLLMHLGWSLAPALTTIQNDFANYYVPAHALRAGIALDRAYERNWFLAESARAGIGGLGSFVPHPPANALLLWPLAGLSPLAAKLVWTCILAACGLVSFALLRPLVACSGWLLALVFLLPSSSWANALMYGQPYPLLLLLLSLSLWAELRGWPFICGLALAPMLVLKLYALPFLLRFLWLRRWRQALGLTLGAAVLTLGSIAALGLDVHAVYAREIWPHSLRGEVQDPYSPIWGSFASLSHRLFQAEPDLNPEPIADVPALARGLAQGLPACVLLLALLGPARDARVEWAVLTLAALAVSPLAASYHFVLLIVPVALHAARAGPRTRIVLLALLAFATSPAPHYFVRFAHGIDNLLAYPRLAVLLALLAFALHGAISLRTVALAAAGAMAAAVVAWAGTSDEELWQRVAAHGYLLAEPVFCGDRVAWTTTSADRLVVRDAAGDIHAAVGNVFAPRCVAGGLVALEARPGQEGVPDLAADDGDPWPHPIVWIEQGSLREAGRVLASGVLRRPRLSPSGAWVVFESWEDGSWDIRALERATLRSVRVTHDPANELEPSWTPEGIVFASDRRRGLGSTALYTVAFAGR